MLLQRQERLEVRQQLESQIAHLMEEVAHLKAVNEQLRVDKQTAEEAMRDYKVKADATIAQLRSTAIYNMCYILLILEFSLYNILD